MKPTDEQIIKILSLVAHEPSGKPIKPGHHVIDDQWWGHDTTCGTTEELLQAARAILSEGQLRWPR